MKIKVHLRNGKTITSALATVEEQQRLKVTLDEAFNQKYDDGYVKFNTPKGVAWVPMRSVDWLETVD